MPPGDVDDRTRPISGVGDVESIAVDSYLVSSCLVASSAILDIGAKRYASHHWQAAAYVDAIGDGLVVGGCV